MISTNIDQAPRRFRTFGTLVVGSIAAAVVSQLAAAATINYGNFGPVPPGVTFLQVTESSGTDPVPLYGPPTPFATGLDFNPTNFLATAGGGSVDITDGQLNFTVQSLLPLTTINLFERGDYTLAGTGTAATEVRAGAVILGAVTAINGVPVAPIVLPAVNASVGFNLVANPGIAQPWGLGLGLNVGAQVPGATRIDIAINNAMVAVSQPSSVALIAKKDFIMRVGTIPEPASVLMTLSGVMIGLAWMRRRDHGRRH